MALTLGRSRSNQPCLLGKKKKKSHEATYRFNLFLDLSHS